MMLPAVVLSAKWYFADTAAKTSPRSALARVVVVLVVVHGPLLDLHGNAANRAQATLTFILASLCMLRRSERIIRGYIISYHDLAEDRF